MTGLEGIGVSPGIGFGKVYRQLAEVPVPPPGDAHGGDADAEMAKARGALEEVAADLEERGALAGGPAEEVLAAQALMARDPDVAAGLSSRIGAGMTAARAVYEAFGTYREILAAAGDYVAARVADLDDVRDRTIAVLLGLPVPRVEPHGPEPYILVAKDLAPADTALLDPTLVAAFVTEQGGPTSHTAILARALGVPAVVACDGCLSIAAGTPVLVDGSSGRVRISPSAATVATARTSKATGRIQTGPGMLASGEPVPLLATIGGPADLPAAVRHGAEGVGLYRTEFLFLGRSTAPPEDEQVAAYRAVLEAFPGGPVVVRTLDAGADKPLAFLPPRDEPNPALGERALRIFRMYPDIMATQLRALARAARGTAADLMVMAPMVADGSEAVWFVDACRQAGLPIAGIMIEIPSAALRARDIAPEVDFFSIGTNDLAQYCFAADRQIGALTRLQDPWQPALLDLVASAAAAGKPCGVCGEAAADPALACVLVGLGVTSLSMGPHALPPVRSALARHTLAECRSAAAAALAATSAASARTAALRILTGPRVEPSRGGIVR